MLLYKLGMLGRYEMRLVAKSESGVWQRTLIRMEHSPKKTLDEIGLADLW